MAADIERREAESGRAVILGRWNFTSLTGILGLIKTCIETILSREISTYSIAPDGSKHHMRRRKHDARGAAAALLIRSTFRYGYAPHYIAGSRSGQVKGGTVRYGTVHPYCYSTVQ